MKKFIVMVCLFMFMLPTIGFAKNYENYKIPSDGLLKDTFIGNKSVKWSKYRIHLRGKFKISDGNYRLYFWVYRLDGKDCVNMQIKSLRRLDTNFWVFNDERFVQHEIRNTQALPKR